uniref:Fibronectin type-III domain-containing protein n=1 Tax=Bicosoecida sp. CB-2014 TaxID=1486930 RepID=A0A7S1GEL7_9STRA
MATPSEELAGLLRRRAPATEAPATPAAPVAERRTCTSVSVRLGGSGAAAAGHEFHVQWGRSGLLSALEDWTTVEGVVRGPVATVTGLSPATEYVVRVRAHNDVGDSAWSPASAPIATLAESGDVPAPPVPPPPTHVKATAHTLTVRYGYRDGTKGVHPTTAFVLQAAAAGGLGLLGYSWQSCNNGVPMVGGSYVLRGLPHGTPFAFRVKATNDGGESEWSEAAVPTAPTTTTTGSAAAAAGKAVTTFTTLPIAVPAAPPAPVFNNTTKSGTVTVAIAAPAAAATPSSSGASGGAGGGGGSSSGSGPPDAKPLTYFVEYGTTSLLAGWKAANGGKAVEVGAAGGRVTVSGLDVGSEYVFRVYAASEAGASPWSATSEPIVCGEGPAAAAAKK